MSKTSITRHACSGEPTGECPFCAAGLVADYCDWNRPSLVELGLCPYCRAPDTAWRRVPLSTLPICPYCGAPEDWFEAWERSDCDRYEFG